MNPCHMEGPGAFSEVQEGREQNSGLVKDKQGMGCGCGRDWDQSGENEL